MNYKMSSSEKHSILLRFILGMKLLQKEMLV